MRRPTSKLKRSAAKGFSLIELMIAMTMVMILLAMTTMILSGINYQFKTQRSRLEAVDNAQTAVDSIIRLVRMAGSRPVTCASGFQFQALTPATDLGNGFFGQLRVQSDWNPADCALTGVEEDITFSAANGVLYLDAAQQTPFVDQISALRFKFFDANRTLITNPQTQFATIAYVWVEIDTLAADGTSTTISSGAYIRK
jgi:type II secretory pathway pseudopilin PulG